MIEMRMRGFRSFAAHPAIGIVVISRAMLVGGELRSLFVECRRHMLRSSRLPVMSIFTVRRDRRGVAGRPLARCIMRKLVRIRSPV